MRGKRDRFVQAPHDFSNYDIYGWLLGWAMLIVGVLLLRLTNLDAVAAFFVVVGLLLVIVVKMLSPRLWWMWLLSFWD